MIHEQMLNTTTNRLLGYDKSAETSPYRAIVAIFFASGFAALFYQIIWQRALFTIFGINVEAVTVVVTVLFGLGFGSLFGGWLSRTSTVPLLVIFGLTETAAGDRRKALGPRVRRQGLCLCRSIESPK
jgi:hypothetical protein